MTLNLRPEERKLCELCKLVPTRVLSRGRDLYDVRVEGICTMDDISEPVRFSAWLPLAAIRSLTKWYEPAIAAMTDHAAMVREGDWSGVRDSRSACHWAIFNTYVVPRIAVTGTFTS